MSIGDCALPVPHDAYSLFSAPQWPGPCSPPYPHSCCANADVANRDRNDTTSDDLIGFMKSSFRNAKLAASAAATPATAAEATGARAAAALVPATAGAHVLRARVADIARLRLAIQ